MCILAPSTSYCFSLGYANHRDFHSFPTRRSSDLLPVRAETRNETAVSPRRRAAWAAGDRKSTRLNSSHANISYAVFCLKKKMLNAPLDPGFRQVCGDDLAREDRCVVHLPTLQHSF